MKLCLWSCFVFWLQASIAFADPPSLTMEPSPGNPRNSEGSFITLKSGRISFYYTQFYGGLEDYAPARIAVIHSDDQGRTWGQPEVFVEKGTAANVMSVSLLRLASGRIAMFYLIKQNALDCGPFMRLSTDEGRTWSAPKRVIDAPGYFVLNNDRVIQTRTGRMIVPVAFNRLKRRELDETPGTKAFNDSRGIAMWFYSDDEGLTWKEATTWWAMPLPSQRGLQEPGVVELADGSLFSWVRTDQGTQFEFRSSDGGINWTPPQAGKLESPLSPASIKRLPGSDSLLAIYNDHSGRFKFDAGRRAPLVAAVSDDGGKSWPRRKVIEADLAGWYCYTAVHFTNDAVLLAYTAGDDKVGRLARLRIRRIELPWLP
ncbi:MAG: exo-alpha-sialidase [Opitutaceae bacterium]|nr:exo-alpha-sialidase [Opitutaceae bacterium]